MTTDILTPHRRTLHEMTRFSRVVAAMALLLILNVAPACRAGLIFQLPDITSSPGSSGAFDILLSNNNPSGGASYSIAGDVLKLTISGPDVSFTGVTITTVGAYLFVTSSSPFSFDTFPNTTFTASDVELAAPFSRTVVPGQTFGAAHVLYSVAPGAGAGLRPFSLDLINTSLSDSAANLLAFTATNGSINVVTTVAPVPEPSAWMMMFAGGSCCLLYSLRRRGRTEPRRRS